MTINDQHRAAATGGNDSATGQVVGQLTGAHALVDELHAGEPYAVAFGGQGGTWLENLEELVNSAGIESEITALVGEAELLLEPVARELVVVRPIGFEPMKWVRALAADEPLPAATDLTTAAISGPGILLTQMAAIRALKRQGLDLTGHPPVAIAGHSQGVTAVESLKAHGMRDVELLAIGQLIGAGGSLVSRRCGMVRRGDKSPMVSVTNVDPARLAELLDGFAQDVRTVLPPALSIRNGRRSVVITGTPEQLARFELYCQKVTEKEEAERKNKSRGGAVFQPMFSQVDVEVGFHTPRLAAAVDLIEQWALRTGLDPELTRRLGEIIFVNPVDWVSEVERLAAAGAKWIIDLGPGDTVTRLTAPVIRGLGIGIVPAATRAGQRSLFTVGAAPVVAPAWSSYAPSAVKLPGDVVKVSTKFTRLTGRSPILLAGMTPTTVDAKIVAAAANAGHWAELAGGGQVTEEILDGRMQELAALLEPGRAVQFNSLFLDPYLWKLQVGGKRLVQKARQSGAPIDGVVVTAGIPELEEAVELIEELNTVGISNVVFKPGTVDQIKAVIKIATEVPERDVIVHIEGGRAGGHHSWEDLDDLLLATYGELRKYSNVTICVGGGIGTPERAADYLSGDWAEYYGFPSMPVDGILVGTAAMAAKEATTSPAVKQMLVETTGTDTWVGAGKAVNGMASGRSQLGADIHEIDNTASRCGRLLDEVAGDADAVAERRDELIAAMASTAKPYFGDLDGMSYLQWLRRYVELAIGAGDTTADTAAPGSLWLADTWRDRFEEMLKRTESRLNEKDFGPIESLFGAGPESSEGQELLEHPDQAIAALLARYPDAESVQLHPADVPFFVTLCKTPGKPVNFVPVIDKDVRRWWRSDSLWQAHDARYSADEVCIIPGTQAVAGITRVDEPVGELLDRFEQAIIDRVVGSGVEPVAVVSRRQARADITGPLAVVLDSPDVLWAGRTAINPVHRIGEPGEWQVNDVPGKPSAIHPSTGARLELAGAGTEGDVAVILSVPLSGIWIDIGFTLPSCTVDGGMPIVTVEDASKAMRAVLAIAAGVEGPDALPPVENGTTSATVEWDPEKVADHTGVTATFGAPLAPGLTLVPDALVGMCWPAVFAAVGSALTAEGFPVVEGLLSLVHLDHAARLLQAMPATKSELTVTATASAAIDTDVGRVVPVTVTIREADSDAADPSTVLATLEERFAIRGRTGAIELTDPPRAGGAITDNATDTPRRRRRDVVVTSPVDMSAFAVVSGDHNPIHTDRAAALLAGLETPIVHGMWLSAAAQHAVTATDGRATPPPRLVGWTSRFLGMVLPGDEVEFRVDRVGIDRGAEIIEVAARVGSELVMSATAQLASPKTVYAFPGQGIQSKGMGMEVRSRSKAARKVWDSADLFTRETLGFSVLHVVRDNPTSIIASGVHYHHPEGVLYLTQFTQVAMATVAAAQVAEMREQGAFVEGAMACGHSVGEYTAIACVSGVYPLEALLEVVFHRGSKMHDIVPRDSAGRSNYRLAAIRPSQIDIDDDDVVDFVEEIAERTGEFLQIVNYNLRGSQYAIAGTVRGLQELEDEVERRREISGGKRSFILVPGIDVPFHSSVLRVGVADFRRSLERVMPRDADPALLVGKYIPNLVPRPFTLDRDFIEEIRDLVPAEPLDEILADYDTWRNEKPRELCRKIVIELLAWQFASPVRWIETQDLLFIEEAAGGLGVERFVEIGVKAMPTVAGLASNTLKLSEYSHNTTEVLNAERDAAVLFATDTDPEPDDELPEEDTEPVAGDAPVQAAPAEAAPVVPASAAPTGGPRPDDLTFDASDATMALIALSAKIRIDQIEPLDSIESITDGASSRRNQMLVDLGSELNLGAIDGAGEADLAGLKAQVTKLARTYKPFGPVLSDSINDQLRTVLGPSGKRPAYIAERVKKTWELGEGWARHVTVEVALGTREGSSVRGDALGGLHDGALGDAASVDKAIDAAVAVVAARQGVAVSLPSTGAAAGGVVDSAALGEFADQVTGPNGVLASAARTILKQLGLGGALATPEASNDAELIDLVTAELGSEWPRLVAPVFDSRKAVVLDDRWASAREDLARIWLMDEEDLESDWTSHAERFEGAGHVVGTQAGYWQGKSLAAGRNIHASIFARAAAGAENPGKGRYTDEVAVVTGASKGSIAASVVAQLLEGGATVVATTSKLDDSRLEFYGSLYRDNARFGAKLWVLPANMASYGDVDALAEWVGSEQTESLGPKSIHIKDALTPTLLFPFAAPKVGGDLSDAGSRSEMEMKVLLWAIQRLIAGLSHIGAERDIAARLHVVLPGSPNRGMFGGDGAYGEAKSALDAVVSRWKAETSWAQRVSLAHALIGWTRGTGLMGHNDVIVDGVEEAGVTTYSTEQMAGMLLDLCDVETKVAAALEPVQADLTGGLAEVDLDLPALAAKAREEATGRPVDEGGDFSDDDSSGTDDRMIAALPSPPRPATPAPPPVWDDLDVDPAELVVIVGGAELGPYGSSRTRFEMEVDNELSAAGVLELAWTTGLIKWEDDPQPGWYDTESGDLVDEADLVERYHDVVVERVGIREFVGDGAIDPDHCAPLLVSVFLDKDFSFVVSSETEARAFVEFDPEHTIATPVPETADWNVVRKAGTEIRVPRKTKLSRTVGAQIPTGFDPQVWGITPDMVNSIDRVALWNLIATVDAFLSAGFSPTELMRWVHPSLVASTQGTGMGGLTSMQTMFHGNLLDKSKPNDILQETLPNVVAAHVIQSYVGSYGSMIHPVGACATAAVSLEEGVDKIRLGKAELVVTGGYDDLTLDSVIGFGDMAATADTEMMRGKGISDSKFSRANDRRRLGFVEAEGGGTILLARGDLALRMGLPVLAVVAHAQSYGDGVHTSIPAPGLGALGAGRGGGESVLARSLKQLGVGADDIAVISKHDTSTLANDPNEQELHERLADSLGRSEGAPLFIVSQKSLTGHAKGGAAVFQTLGLCQVLRDGVIPPNRSLDCVDEELATSGHFVWPRETLKLGEKFPLKAGLVTSLGFGHVSGLIALVHPQAFLATLRPEQAAEYRARAAERSLAGQRRLASAIAGGRPMYERPADRRFDDGNPEKTQEAAMLLDAASRLGEDDVYER